MTSKTAKIVNTLIDSGTGNVSAIVAAVTGFTDLAMMLPDELKACGDMDGDADRIFNWAVNILNPVWVMVNLPTRVI